jgi:hypothetical protein
VPIKNVNKPKTPNNRATISKDKYKKRKTRHQFFFFNVEKLKMEKNYRT